MLLLVDSQVKPPLPEVSVANQAHDNIRIARRCTMNVRDNRHTQHYMCSIIYRMKTANEGQWKSFGEGGDWMIWAEPGTQILRNEGKIGTEKRPPIPSEWARLEKEMRIREGNSSSNLNIADMQMRTGFLLTREKKTLDGLVANRWKSCIEYLSVLMK